MPGPSAQPASGEPLVEFVEVMRRLRSECPWKAEQTHSSLARYLQEEAHETLEAIDVGEASGDWDHLREELGDLLLQVYFHAAIAEERGEWTIDDVAADIVAKLRRRNPHVFGEGAGSAGLTAEDVNAEWERLKAREKSQRTSVTDGLPPALPALLYADKVLDRLSRAAGVDPGQPLRRTSPGTSDAPVAGGAAASDVPETGGAAELGERLLDLVAEARAAGVDPEQALRHAVRRRVEAAEG
ncbi:MazG family protein [Nocardioides sediminis]|uniref:MazG family protein n=1 Tax=Nocardioides sediminis TaxID=433648 RepID=UPI001F3F5EA0|nr:MazG family protein [Nocardioides sediminis]